MTASRGPWPHAVHARSCEAAPGNTWWALASERRTKGGGTLGAMGTEESCVEKGGRHLSKRTEGGKLCGKGGETFVKKNKEAMGEGGAKVKGIDQTD